jgi:hypothetical protein
MTHPLASMRRLAPRNGAGLTCDHDGIALGPAVLIERTAGPSATYRLRPRAEIERALTLAYGRLAASDVKRWHAGINAAARALQAGDIARAAVIAVQLRPSELTAGSIAKLAADRALKKYSPDQPRDERGRWTGDRNPGDPSASGLRARPSPSARTAQSISDGRVAGHKTAADGSIQVHVNGTDGRTYVYAGIDPSTAAAPGTFIRSGDTVGSILNPSADSDIQTEPLPPPTRNIPGTDIPDRGIPENARRRPLGPTPNEHADEGITVGPPDANIDTGIDRPRIPQDKITPRLRPSEESAARKPIRPRLPR